MVENSMVIGNHQDSSFNNVMDYCQSCSKEIYFGEEYRDIDGDYIHDETDCIKQYVESHSIKKVAGE
ncbi:hypothetical protein FO512_27515 [Bacillus cereus]|nr:hypothetical protein [Bacillus cereus]MDR4441789.1 hypothetical protein [Bacillus cereus]